MKETQESKVWGKNNGFCGAKVGGEYNVGHVPSQISCNGVLIILNNVRRLWWLNW
jgi:hypothetical protein